jgi:hypothetical protein
LAVFSVNGDDGWQGSAGQHTYCVPSTQTPRCKPEKQKTTNTFIYYQTLLLTIKHFKRMKKHFLLLLWMTLLPLAGWGQKDLGLEVLTGTTYNGSAAATAPVISVTTPTKGLEITTNTSADYHYEVTYHNSASDAQSGSSTRDLTNLTPVRYFVRVT